MTIFIFLLKIEDMSKSNFIIEENKDKGYIKVQCKDGHYLTDWDKKDILDYTYSKVMFCPLNYNLDNYYCVSDEEHGRYVAEQEAKLALIENNDKQ